MAASTRGGRDIFAPGHSHFLADILFQPQFHDAVQRAGLKLLRGEQSDTQTALHTAKTMRHPTAILMRTVKGKGVSFMEDDSKWHGAPPSDEELVRAIAEIKEGGVV